jgi:polyhydroxyalkanoate synthesis regulator phasin
VANTATAPAAAAQSQAQEFSGKNVAELRDAITRGVIRPLNLIMLTRDRIEEVVNDAVERGRMTAEDAQTIVQGLVARGREQTDSVMSDLEGLLERGRGEIAAAPVTAVSAVGKARKQVADTAKGATKRARESADPVIAQADRARRVAGVGPSFPILGYDDLTAAQVQARLDGLSAAELRKVRDYEKRNANRKSVLDGVQRKLDA